MADFNREQPAAPQHDEVISMQLHNPPFVDTGVLDVGH
jgi:hypothetical protein